MDETVARLGEFGLIEEMTARYPHGDQVLLGPGDDAAVVRAADGQVVCSTDLVVEGRHFRRDWSSAYDVGRKAAAQNLADIAAMGARPTALLTGLAFPPDLPADWVLRFTEGLRAECAPVGTAVVGGDLVRAPVIMVAVTALGDLEGRTPVTRSGANAGDVVAVCGRLGWSAAGLAALEHRFIPLPSDGQGAAGPADTVEPTGDGEAANPFAPFAAVHRRPEPPYAAGPAAAGAGATAMIDVSDGLIADLGHIAQASGVQLDLDRKRFEVPPAMAELAARCGRDPLDWVLGGGEDHALAGTFPAEAPLPAGWQPVGQVTGAAAGGAVTVDGRPWAGATGWDHFPS